MHPQLTVASYNIRWGKGLDGRVDLKRIASVLQTFEADVIVLNEVERRGPRGRMADPAKTFADALGMHAFMCPAIRMGPFGYGNLVLTREEPAFTQLLKLPRGRWRHARTVLHRSAYPVAEPRSAAVVGVRVRGQDWTVFGTHLGYTAAQRRTQAEVLAQALAAAESPTVLAGDLNAVDPTEAEVAPLMSWGGPLGPAELSTFPSDAPREQRDYIIPGPDCAIIRATTHQVPYSDHIPIVAVVSYQEPHKDEHRPGS